MDTIEFINRVASSDPVPGGGSVSALAGALAASLATMVARLTTGRKKYASVEPRMIEIINEIEPTIALFHDDIARDSDAYAAVMSAFKLPKETDEEKATRAKAIEEATIQATLVPLEVARRACNLLPLIAEVGRDGNSNAVTDAAVAILCCRTAVIGASLNVAINLPGISDAGLVAKIKNDILGLISTADKAEAALISNTLQQILPAND